jgi:hypothetical protein
MLLSVLFYTISLTVFLPQAWLDPFGALLKNLAILVLIPVVAITSDPR